MRPHPHWLGDDGLIHGMLYPEDTPRNTDITFCWQLVNRAARKTTHRRMNCLFCVAYEERAKAWV